MIGKNNPLNIRSSSANKWQGQIGRTRGFCDFSDMYYGIRACMYLLVISYPRRGIRTLRQIVYAYAPPFENNTDNYLNFVCLFTGMSPDFKPYSFLNFIRIIEAMSIMEGNKIEIDANSKYYVALKSYFSKYIKKLK